MNQTDELLIQEILDNNPSAFERLLLAHNKTISIGKSKYNVDTNSIHDILYNIILSFKTNKTTINDLDAYLFVCIKNFKISCDKNSKNAIKLREKLSLTFENTPFHSDICFYELLEQLDQETQLLLKLKILHQFSLREIQKQTGISKSTIDYKLKKAYARLRHILSC